ncbi:endonuclease/exonuclease/phosphatase family protein [Hanstruepera ponticola]|uniref:endonuclease/exonuclease/phosphatase family protein n=1 Tax=Hanstruepera ponticola TaxID=2042995 RepID=UPI000CF01D02|nr:endonuclease/exonuclease/phosphatase family protein [Hanstruepera ponticola]
MTKSLFTVAFYNLENLFDTYDDVLTNDNDFLPDSVKRWTPKRYQNKLRKLGFAISNIGKEETGNPPALIGLAEVENNLVLDDLLNSEHLANKPYDYVHFDSPDERGIDVALIYDTSVFEVEVSEVFPVHIYDDDGSIDYTRDILLVRGILNAEHVHIMVNHWPSRHDGELITEPKRLLAAEKVGEIIQQIKTEDQNAKIIVMGDFNDDPFSNSIKRLMQSNDLYNPMATLLSDDSGTTRHFDEWNLFDQILFSTNFFETTPNRLSFSIAALFDEDFLKQYRGPFKGAPFRTYVGKKYKGGYSDHFPVYIILEEN